MQIEGSIEENLFYSLCLFYLFNFTTHARPKTPTAKDPREKKKDSVEGVCERDCELETSYVLQTVKIYFYISFKKGP